MERLTLENSFDSTIEQNPRKDLWMFEQHGGLSAARRKKEKEREEKFRGSEDVPTGTFFSGLG